MPFCRAKTRNHWHNKFRFFRPTLCHLESRLTPTTRNWSGLGDGSSWNDSANWQNGLPFNGDSVVIDDVAATTLVHFNVAGLNLASLDCDEAIQIDLGAGLTLTSSAIGTGMLANAGGLSLVNASVLLPIDNQGMLDVFGPNNTLGETFHNAAGALLRLTGEATFVGGQRGHAALTVSKGVTNDGTLELWSSRNPFGTGEATATVTTSSGTLLNSAAGLIRSLTINGPSIANSLAATLNNQGKLEVQFHLNLAKASVAHTNSGTIDVAGGDMTITQSGTDPTFATTGTIKVAADRTLTVSGGTFNYGSGNLDITGTLTFTAATANFTPNFTNNALLNVSSSTLDGPGALTNALGKTLMFTAGTIGPSMTLENKGTMDVFGSGNVVGSSIHNASGALFRLIGEAIFIGGQRGSAALTASQGLVNDGTLELWSSRNPLGSGEASATLTTSAGALLNSPSGLVRSMTINSPTIANALAVTLDNQGTFEVQFKVNLAKASAQHASSGTIDVAGGDMTITQSGTAPTFTTTGNFKVAAGRNLIVDGGTFNVNSGTFSVGGNVTLSSTLASFTPNVANNAVLSLTSATLNGPGTLINAAGKTINLHDSTIAAPIENNGFLNFPSGNLSNINGPLTTAAGSAIYLAAFAGGNCNLNFSNGFTNHGTIELLGNANLVNFAVASGTLVNAVDGIIRSNSGGGPRSITAQLDNQGLVSVLSPLIFNGVSSQHLNSGTIEVTGGDLTITQSGSSPSFSTSGNIKISSGRTLNVNGGSFNYDSGTLNDAGALAFSKATATFAQDYTNPSTLKFDQSTIAGPGTVTNAAGKTLVLNDSTISSTCPIFNKGLLDLPVTNNSFINGPLMTAPGSTFRLTSNVGAGNCTLTISNGFTNHGTIELLGDGNSTNLTVSTGTLVNAADGAIRINSTTPAGRTITASFDNQGTLDVRSSLTLTNSGKSFNAAGTIKTLAEKTLTINGGTTVFAGAVFVGPGTVDLAGTHTFQLENNLNLLAAGTKLGLSGTVTLSGPGTLTVGKGQALTVALDTINCPLVNQGLIDLPSGNNSFINGPLTTVNGSTIRLTANGGAGNCTLTVSGGLTNHGTIEFLGNDNAANFIVNSGKLFNAADGTIRANASGGVRFITAQLENLGTIEDQFHLTISNLEFVGGALKLPLGRNLTIAGPLTGSTKGSDLFKPTGRMTLAGAGTSINPQLIEVFSADRGATAVGFNKNFAYGTVQLTSTFVRLVDAADNALGLNAEALYVDALIVPSGSTLDLNGLKAYARSVQVDGTVIGGTINVVPDSGPLTLNVPASGLIATIGQVDEWTVFGRAGEAITFIGNPADASPPPISPPLGVVRVDVLAPDNSLLSTGSSPFYGQIVTLHGVELPVDGIYRIRVRATDITPNNTGYYQISAFEARVDSATLLLGQKVTGLVDTQYSVDRWTFAAAANTKVRLDVIATASDAIRFKLMGPSGFVGFDQPGETGVITLPEAGPYLLEVYSTGNGAGAYTYRLDQISIIDLPLGNTTKATLVGSDDSRLFHVNLTESGPLVVIVDDATDTDRTEVYFKHGSLPTRQSFDHKHDLADSADHFVHFQASPGDWYVLVYGERVPTSSELTIEALNEPLVLRDVTPNQFAASAGAIVTIGGVGFLPGTQVELHPIGGGSPIPAQTVAVDSIGRVTANFNFSGTPAGNYDVVVSLPGGVTDTLNGALIIVSSGKAQLETKLILPPVLGRHAAATLYIEYANTGTVAMVAPLLTLQSPDRPLLTLDANYATYGFWSTASLPQGFTTHASILASGKTPGLLLPGERMKVPVSYAGLQTPYDFTDTKVEFEIRIRDANDSSPNSLGSLNSRPDWINTDAWSAIASNIVAAVGSTWGDAVYAFAQNAMYLDRLGQPTTDLSELYSFEVQQANGLSPVKTLAEVTDAEMPTPGIPLRFARQFSNTITSRYHLGLFGRGWSSLWESRLTFDGDGNLSLFEQGDTIRRFSPDLRNPIRLLSTPGDEGELTKAGSQYELRESNGLLKKFQVDGRLDYIEDRNGNRITVGYTGSLLTSLTHSAGTFLSMAYNAAGRISSVTDSAGRMTTYTYDPSNELLIASSSPLGTTLYGYHDASAGLARRYALLSVQRPNGVTRSFSYDARGRLVSTNLNGNAEHVDYAYDTAGRVTVTDADGTINYASMDSEGRVARYENGLGQYKLRSFDEAGHVTRLIDTLGAVTNFSWDANTMTSFTDPMGGSSQFKLGGPFNQATEFADPLGHTTTYSYDDESNPLISTYADGMTERGTYDAAGNIVTYTLRDGRTTNLTYNAAGNTTQVNYPDGTIVFNAYDNRERLISVTDPQGVTNIAYNTADHVTKITYPNGRFLAYTYDAANRRTKLSDGTGYEIRYEFDSVSRLAGLRDAANLPIVTYTYGPSGKLIREDKGNGTFTTYAYNLAGRVASIVHHAPGGAITGRFDYTYDALGRRISTTTLDGTWTYTYDLAGQLTHANFASLSQLIIPNQDLAYTYDASGNRTKTIVNGTTTNYATNALNEYTSAGSTVFTYDANGNLILEQGPSGTKSYTYNIFGLLTKVESGGDVWQYEYDAFNNRSAQIFNGQRTESVHDVFGLNDVIADYDGSGNRVASYAHGLGLAGTNVSSGWRYFDFDALGSTAAVTDGMGANLNRYVYDPFGGSLVNSETVSNRFRFNGALGVVTDTNGLLDMRARAYHSGIGRFTSPDPLRLAGGDVNFYRFVGNQPTNDFDPLGLSGGATAFGNALNRRNAALEGDPEDPNYQDNVQDANQDVADSAQEFNQDLGDIATDLNSSQRDPTDLGKAIKDAFDFIMDFAGTIAPRGPSPNPGGDGGDTGDSNSAGSTDPNEKETVGGFGPQHFIARYDFIPYRVRFENLGPGSIPTPTQPATAPAQRVVVTDQLDANLDWSTLRFTEFGFGDTTKTVRDNSTYYFTTVSMTQDDKTFDVEVEFCFDSDTGLIRAVFQSLDPATQLPPDVLTGFLPPEDGTGCGQGYFAYTVQPKSTLVTGTEIRNVADIRFDINPIISTNQIDPFDPATGTDPNKEALNTIDAGNPASTVAALPATTTSGPFLVSWSGTDDASGSGIGVFDVFVSDNGGQFMLWQSNTSATSAVFVGQDGHTYGFYSVAIDNVGNRQSTPASAQATTTLDVHAPIVQQIKINDGSAQRSLVTNITVTFNTVVQLPAAPAMAFMLTNPSGPITLAVDWSSSTPLQTIAKLTFSGPQTDFGSLSDGKYTLSILSNQVQDGYGHTLDGNGDGNDGDDYVLIGTPPNGLFRLFGDADGDASVNSIDFAAFRTFFGLSGSTTFDFNNDSLTNASDFSEFRKRFGISLTP